MKVVKRKEQVTCRWCNAGATMTFADARGEFCMACKRHLRTGEPMRAPPGKPPDDPRSQE